MKKNLSIDYLSRFSPFLSVLLFAVSFLVYAQTIQHEFALDDFSVIVNHQHVQNGVSGIDELLKTNYRHGNSGFNDGLYRPLSLITFAVEQSLFNGSPTISHLINLLIYALGVMILYRSLQAIFHSFPLLVPFSIAMLFALHPLHTEVVSNIKSRDELLAFIGFVSCLHFAIKQIDHPSKWNLSTMVLSYFIALFSKESSVTYCLAIPILLLMNPQITFKKISSIFFILFPLAIGFFILRLYIISEMSNPIDEGNFGILNNPIAATDDLQLKWGSSAALQLIFLKKLFYPFELIHDYSFNQIPLVTLKSPSAIIGLLIFISLSFAAILGIVKRKIFGLIAALYLISVSVASQFVPIGVQFAERMLFLAVLPFTIFITLLLYKFFQKKYKVLPVSKQQRLAFIILVLAITYGTQSFQRNRDWKDNFTLYQADIEKASNSARANYNLGTELSERAKQTNHANQKKQLLNSSVFYLERAIRIYPEYIDAYNNLGIVYKQMGNQKKAIQVFLKNIELDPDYHKNYYNLATAYMEDKRYKEAILSMQEFVERNPTNSDAYYLMGKAAGNQQDFKSAIHYLNQALSIDPNHLDALKFLGLAYGISGDAEKAVIQFEKAAQLYPNDIDILMNLALSYHQLSNYNKEEEILKRILAIDPTNEVAQSQINQIKKDL